MRPFWFISGLFVCTKVAHSIPTPLGPQFEIDTFLQDITDEDFAFDDLIEVFEDGYEELNELDKRDEKTIESVLLTLNRSGIIFDLLDQIADHPNRISILANATAGLIKRLGDGNLDVSQLTTIGAGLNISSIYDVVKDSGLVTSLLDGILLDDDYRPVLVKLITRIVESNKSILAYIFNVVLQKRDLLKRADNEGSLITFVTNIVSTVLASDLLGGFLTDTVNALNDTGVAVYIVKTAIADELYQNMTAQLAKDIYATGVIKLNSSALNVTSLVDKALSDPTRILTVVSAVLSGNLKLSGFGKYGDGIKAIISDLEDNGLFSDLNNYLFSSSKVTVSTGSLASASATVTANKKAAAATTTAATLTSNSGAGSTTPWVSLAVMVQLFVFSLLI